MRKFAVILGGLRLRLWATQQSADRYG